MKNVFKKVIISVISWQAKLVLKKYKPKIVGVTGSVGKTSTKDALYLALTPSFYVRKSEKSFNSDTGVPLSILGLPNGWTNPLIWIKNIFDGFMLIALPHKYPNVLVLEIGTDKPGDITGIVKWLKPDVAVITHFPIIPAHIEFFESREEVIKEKSALALAVPKEGYVVLNSDDEDVLALREKVDGHVITYGRNMEANIRTGETIFSFTHHDGNFHSNGVETTIFYNGTDYKITLPYIISEQHVASVTAAFAVGVVLGGDPEKIIYSLSEYKTPAGRLVPIEGINNSLIIDDTYNSSPFACEASLRTLGGIKTKGRRIAVLGDMLELGKHSIDAHKEIGKIASQSADMLVTVGIRAKQISESAFTYGIKQDNIKHFDTSKEAGEYLKGIIGEGDVILFKASQGIRMEKAIPPVMAHPEDASRILVRQDREWNMR